MRNFVMSFLGAVLLVCGLAWATGQILSVQVRTCKLRSRPSFLGKVVGELSYTDQVSLQQQKGPWVEIVGPDDVSGWLHESALSEDKIVMTSGGEVVPVGTSGQELALAGKGFNPEVEGVYQQDNPELNFALVDRMEAIVVSPEQAQAFLDAGRVQPDEGGR